MLTGVSALARTVLLRAVTGLQQVSGGRITVAGRDNRNPAERAWRTRACAWLPCVNVAPGPVVRADTTGAPGAGPAVTSCSEDRPGGGRLSDRPTGSLARGEVQTWRARSTA